ncbi:hypothetical protein IRJ41_016582 [Triplophysa rosa]|uniref:Uncharacterized protein n=1 Tax=Triplophysa rosa TaxID=992332 RepID=A0A9W7X0C6_TRIRA|nr:hypothetical protein IRJ41_016582 [Triplophysa rosa]
MAPSLYNQLTSQTHVELFRDQQLEVFDLSTEGSRSNLAVAPWLEFSHFEDGGTFGEVVDVSKLDLAGVHRTSPSPPSGGHTAKNFILALLRYLTGRPDAERERKRSDAAVVTLRFDYIRAPLSGDAQTLT